MIDINRQALGEASNTIRRTAIDLNRALGTSGNVMGIGLSSISGVSEAGGIHGRFLEGDPASAQESLKKMSEHISWMGSLLRSNASVYGMQELINSMGLERSVMGVSQVFEENAAPTEPDTAYQPLSFMHPVVTLVGDMNTIAAQVQSINVGQIAESVERWQSLATAVGQTIGQMEQVSAQIDGENRGLAIDAAVRRLGESVERGTQFVTNAEMMAAKTGALLSGVLNAQVTAAAQQAAVNMIIDPAARVAAETGARTMLQGMLQAAVTTSLPAPGSLMQPMAATGGGTVEVGMDAKAGLGHEYSGEQVQWPQSLVDAAARGEIGPGSFEVVNGQLQPVQGIGMGPGEIAQFREAAARTLESVARAGDVPGLLGDVVTNAASVPTAGGTGFAAGAPGIAGPAGLNGLASGGYGTGVAGAGSGAGFGSVPLVAQSGAGAPGGGVSAGQGARGVGTGGLGTLGRGAAPGMGGFGIGGLGTGGVGAGGVGAGRLAASGLPRGLTGGVGNARGALMGLGSGAGSGVGAGGGALGRGGVPGAGGASGTGASAGAGAVAGGGRGAASASMGRGAMPVMGAGAQGRDADKRGSVKSVTSQVELDPNRKALLGQLPAAVPGVIGAWVRQ